MLDEELNAALDGLREANLYRRLLPIESAHDRRVTYGGRSMVMLASNNYLGLAAHLAVKQAAVKAIERWGVGAASSRLIAGTLEVAQQLEEALARLKRAEAALVFGSGYLANIGTIPALVQTGDVIFSDELNHASLIDGCRLSRATIRIYRHRDPDHLKSLLEDSRGARRRLIVTDSVFSMDGDLAPLTEIVELARRERAAVMVDEAHATGVIGPGGSGLTAHLGLEREIDVQMGTLSKALGSYGAYVAGSRTLIDYLVNRARGFIFTTGLPPAMAAAAMAALDLLAREPERISNLWNNAGSLRARLEQRGFRLAPTATPILPVLIGDSRAATDLQQALFERGIFVTAIRPPTVPDGTARLRVTPIATHIPADLEQAAQAFGEAGRILGLI